MKEMIKSERNIILSATTTTENGERLAEGDFSLKKTDNVLTFTNFGASGTGRTDPSPRYMLLYYIGHHATDLFRFSLDVGDTWIQAGSSHAWHAQMKTSLEGYEQVEVSVGVFSHCLKHKRPTRYFGWYFRGQSVILSIGGTYHVEKISCRF